MSSISAKPGFRASASTDTTGTPDAKANDPASHHVKGLKLVALLASLTLVTFLSFLDTSIIGTVRSTYLTRSAMIEAIANIYRPYPTLLATFTHWQMWVGTSVPTLSERQPCSRYLASYTRISPRNSSSSRSSSSLKSALLSVVSLLHQRCSS